jgi:erythromycin esterase
MTELAEAPRPGSLDALTAASHHRPLATDLRTLPAADLCTLRAVSQQRFGSFYSELDQLRAYDVIVRFPTSRRPKPDQDAPDHAPHEVQEAFSRWKPE